jgi:hypothetical protein
VGIAWLVESTFRAAYPERELGQFWMLAALLTLLLLGGTLLGVPGRFLTARIGRGQSSS